MDSDLMILIRRCMPNFHIHSKEEYHSMLINEYITKCVKSADNLHLTIADYSCKTGTRDILQLLVNVVELVDENHEQVVDVVFYMFFPYNGNIGIVKQGEHWYDMEHVTLRFRGTLNDIYQQLMDQIGRAHV